MHLRIRQRRESIETVIVQNTGKHVGATGVCAMGTSAAEIGKQTVASRSARGGRMESPTGISLRPT